MAPLRRRLPGGARGSRQRQQGGDRQAEKPQNRWRQRSEAFREAMRAARSAARHMAEGRPVSDLPPARPTPAELDDRVPCPHCGRRFGAEQAERHISLCRNIQARPRRLVRSRPVSEPPSRAAPPAPTPPGTRASGEGRVHYPGLSHEEVRVACHRWSCIPAQWEECAICLESDLNASCRQVVELPCGHRFHGRCIGEWLEKQCLCALCKEDVRPHLPRSLALRRAGAASGASSSLQRRSRR